MFIEDHDTGDADLGNVRCCCTPWCGWPTCIACGEEHASSPEGRCRDCDLEHGLDRMHCTGCDRMRYRTNAPIGLSDFARSIWGDPCVCAEPRPPTRAECRTAVLPW